MKSGTQPMELLRLLSLNRNTWVSAADIARLLFTSPEVARKLIQFLRRGGVAIETRWGHGYRLLRGRRESS